MRFISKGIEPNSLTHFRAQGNKNYIDFPDKETLRSALVREQRGLCCYCLSRIRDDALSTKIEHWRSQSRHLADHLNYSNLLAACKGGEGLPQRLQHCDTYKGESDLSRNPANPQHHIEDLIRFEGSGRVSSHDPAFDQELNDVLNLNTAFLVENRKQVLQAFIEALPKLGPLSKPQLNKYLQKWNGGTSSTTELQPFCQVIVYWLKKRLAKG